MGNNILLESKLNEVLQRAVDKGEVAGINALILKNGEELAYTQAGLADISKEKPFDRDTIMRMYSMSKPITSAAVMILVERGLISLGEPVSKYLPGFVNQKINLDKKKTQYVRRPAYLRDLMSMTSGLPYGNAEGDATEVKVQELFDRIDKKLYTKKALSTVEIANELGKIGVSFQPGDYWMYGTSADVLGAIVEVVSGMSFGEFLQKELFDPLDMVDTGFTVALEKADRLAQAYERKDGKIVFFPTDHLGLQYERKEKPAFESGGAGLCSTIDDYAHYATMLLNGGEYNGRRILSESTVNYMTHGKLTRWQQERMWYDWDGHAGFSYGCLMHHMIDTQMSYYTTWPDEYGWDGWLGTYFANCPENKVTLLLGMQISNPEGNTIFEKVRNTLGQFV